MPGSSLPKTVLAQRVWQLMFAFLMRTAPLRTKSLGRRGLTPNDSRALASLNPLEGRTMRSLADEWECDASNATWIVDRLEGFGLAERRTVPHDRRVKLVVLTKKGVKMKTELLEEFHTPPAELLQLDHGDLEALRRSLERLPPPSLVASGSDRKVQTRPMTGGSRARPRNSRARLRDTAPVGIADRKGGS
jgi:DNA-binding MarR family transcriptional regulator